MSPLDLLVVTVIVGCVAWPALHSGVTHLVTLLQPRPAAPSAVPAAGGSIQEWRQAWASKLIELIDELESGKAGVNKPEPAVRLAKELLWQIIGGGGPTPTAP